MTRRNGTPAAYVKSPLVAIPFRPYAPPSVEPARKGAADYKRLPSVAAGIRRPYWAADLK